MVLTILAFIAVLGATVTVHEFGHFAMAKLLKIRVHVFSLGFGRRLLGFTRGGTDYRISAFPIGGYVKMAGETYDEERQGADDEFLSHSRWHRLLVYIAGPCMNVLLATVVLTYPYLEGVTVPRYHKQSPVVGPVAAGSAAYRAGLRSGDRILSVRGSSVRTWEELEITLATAPKDQFEMQVSRGGDRLTLRLDPGSGTTMEPAALGFRFTIPRTFIAAVDPASPAKAGGLRAGDEILSVERGGQVARGFDAMLNLISESAGVPLRFEVRRNPDMATAKGQSIPIEQRPAEGEILHLNITPKDERGRGVAGFGSEIPVDLEKYDLQGAFRMSVRRNIEISALTFRIIGRIITGSASVRTLSGPLEIAQLSGSAARTGSARVFLTFLSMVSLQLGLFNLLPIPILDGGGIAMLAIESVIRRDLSLKLKERIAQVGFALIIVLMGFVVLNDLSKIVNLEKILR